MAILSIYRSGSLLSNVHIGKDTVYKGVVMASDKITAKFSSPEPITFQRGDYIQHNGQTYRLDRVPELKKWSSNGFTYSAEFEGLSYRLYDRLMRHLGSLVFSYFGTPETFLQLIIDNINEIDPGWTIGTVEAISEGKILEFSGTSCREALTSVAKAFNLEFSFDGKEISLVNSVGLVISGFSVSYGQGNGLYTLNRKNTDSRIVTRFIGVGGNKNLPEGYRGVLNNLSFDVGYVDRNVSTHGVIEALVPFDHIYPRRTAAITSAPAPAEIIDTTIDFNLNDNLIEGQSKIVFTTGDLGGNEFEIISYDHTTKKIKFKPNKEDSGYELPNSVVKPEIGDLYTLVGITMPTSYVTAAEAELLAATNDHADINQSQFNAYDLEIDEKFIRDNLWTGLIWAGDRIHTEDADMNLDATLRIQEISYPLSNPSQITAVLSDQVIYSAGEKIIQSQIETRKNLGVLKKAIQETGRVNSIRREELRSKIFDPDDYFDPVNIKPQSIEALHLSIGSRTQDFALSVLFKPNYGADANVMQWTSGVITHFTIDSAAIKVWDVDAGSISALTSGQAYYIYVKALRVGTSAIITVDTVQRKVDSDPTYYYFLVGVLSSVIGGVRIPTFTYGFSELNGRFITTGRIQSFDTLTYIDLDTGAAAGTFTFRAGSSGYNNITDKPDLSGFALTSSLKAMAYEDIVNIAKLDSTIIVGGMLKTTLIDAAYVKASIVNAAYIQTLDLVANKITSGLLQSVNTLNYFDLDNNKFKVGNATNYMDWNVTTPNVLTIKGHITADSGTIAGVTINANDLFSLVGTLVQIYPAAGLASQGYANFTGSLKIPVSSPGSPAAGHLWAVDAVAAGSAPVNYANLYSLLDVNIGGQTNGQALVWNSSTGKWVAGTVAAGSVDLTNYWTKSESDGRYLQLTGGTLTNNLVVTGSDARYINVTSTAGNYAYISFVAGANDGYILQNAPANAANGATSGALYAYMGNGQNFDFVWSGVSKIQFTSSGGATFASTVNAPTFSGALSGTASNATLTDQRTFSRVRTDGINRGSYGSISISGASGGYSGIDFTDHNLTFMVHSGSQGMFKDNTTWLWYWDNLGVLGAGTVPVARISGLGSNALTSTAYLPLAGGTLTGTLYGTDVRISNWLYTSSYYGIYNSTYGGHFYQRNTAYWSLTPSNTSTYGGIIMMQTHESGTKGYLYWDSTGVGLLNDVGGWSVRANYGGSYGGKLFGIWDIETAASIGTGTRDSKFNVFTSGVYGLRIGYGGGTDNYIDGANHYFRSAGGESYIDIKGSELLVHKAITFNQSSGSGSIITSSYAGTTGSYMNFSNAAGAHYIGIDNNVGSHFGGNAYSFNIYIPSGRSIHFVQAGTVRYTLEGSGNNTWTGSGTFNSNLSAAGIISAGSYFSGADYYASSWFRVTGNAGLYANDYAAYFRRSISASHGSWELGGYNKGSYSGLNFIDNSGYWNNFMFEGGNGGWYKENHTSAAKWIMYYQMSAGCLGLNGAATEAGYGVYVTGGLKTTGAFYSLSTGYFGGDVIAYYSDIRLKDIKGRITNALLKLHQVSGVHYEANDHAISIGAVNVKKNEVGLIAQEWQVIMPEVLALAPFDMDSQGRSKSGMNYMTMKYERTVPLIIEAVKEMDNKYTREIAQLKREVSELRSMIN